MGDRRARAPDASGQGALLYLDFLINVVGLEAGLAGAAIGIGRLWDAGNDLLFGTLSDRTRSRWGRRRPYLLFGAVPLLLMVTVCVFFVSAGCRPNST